MATSRYFRGEGVVEYLIVLALFALAAVGTVAIFGDDLRATLGIGSPRAVAPVSTGTAPTPTGLPSPPQGERVKGPIPGDHPSP